MQQGTNCKPVYGVWKVLLSVVSCCISCVCLPQPAVTQLQLVAIHASFLPAHIHNDSLVTLQSNIASTRRRGSLPGALLSMCLLACLVHRFTTNGQMTQSTWRPQAASPCSRCVVWCGVGVLNLPRCAVMLQASSTPTDSFGPCISI